MNRSSAVMQQRSEPHDSLDDFPTPPWATRALCERLGDLSGLTCREPAANRGHMVRPLSEHFARVIASDIHDYGAGFPVQDFLFLPATAYCWIVFAPIPAPFTEFDWIAPCRARLERPGDYPAPVAMVPDLATGEAQP